MTRKYSDIFASPRLAAGIGVALGEARFQVRVRRRGAFDFTFHLSKKPLVVGCPIRPPRTAKKMIEADTGARVGAVAADAPQLPS